MKIFAFLSQSHYLVGTMVFVAIAALIIGIIRYNHNRNLRILTWYIAFSLLQDMAAYYAFPYDGPNGNFPVKLMEATTIAFVFFEFISCNLFILHYIRSAQRRRIIWITGLLCIALLTLTASLTFPHYLDDYYFVPEAVFLVIPCLFYFYELFLTLNLRPLTDQPAFWAVTGILFLNACDIPLLITASFLKEKTYYFNDAYSLNYVLYAILFVLLIRAFLCPPERAQTSPAFQPRRKMTG